MNMFTSKVTPAQQEQEDNKEDKTQSRSMFVMLIHDLLKRYGAQRHPKLETFETLKAEGALTEYKYVPPDSTIIYVSHEWVGTYHPDPNGDQMYHFLLLLERLLRGDVSRTDMDAMHSLVYKHNYTTTAKEWKRVLDPQRTFVFYDGLCVSKEKRDEEFGMIPEYIKRCDFMIILAPGCTHFDKIDPRTGRKTNLCYRTYRLNATCVFEMFSSYLSTKGGEQVRPALLVRSGTGTPNWISPMECQKLAVGMSTFECRVINRLREEFWNSSSMQRSIIYLMKREIW